MILLVHGVSFATDYAPNGAKALNSCQHPSLYRFNTNRRRDCNVI